MKSALIAVLVMFTATAYAQIDTVVSLPVGCAVIPTPPLTVSPPLNTGMELKCLLGYIALDSLCRTVTSREEIDSLAALITNTDTLRLLLQYYYAMTEFDATLLNKYEIYGKDLNVNYKLYPVPFVRAIIDKMDTLLGEKDITNMLVRAGVILHVRVHSIKTDTDYYTRFPIRPLPIRCVAAEVIDTIKGINYVADSGYYVTAQPTSVDSVHFEGISFTYHPSWYTNPRSRRQLDYSVYIDSAGGKHVANSYSDTAVMLDQEYIAFLYPQFEYFDGSHVYYKYLPLYGFERFGGLIPIHDGKVSDPDNYFQLGQSPTVQEFITSLRDRIAAIKFYDKP